MEFDSRSRIDTSTSITPLIDVVFLLLIFFMLTSSMVLEESLQLALPSSSTASVSDEESLTVEIDEEGVIFFRGAPVEIKELEEALLPEFRVSPEKVVLVRSDASVPVQLFVSIMDAVKAAGGQSVSLATKKE